MERFCEVVCLFYYLIMYWFINYKCFEVFEIYLDFYC